MVFNYLLTYSMEHHQLVYMYVCMYKEVIKVSLQLHHNLIRNHFGHIFITGWQNIICFMTDRELPNLDLLFLHGKVPFFEHKKIFTLFSVIELCEK